VGVARVWDQLAERPPGRVQVLGDDAPGAMRENRTVIFAKVDAFADLKAQAGQTATFAAPRGEPRTQTTYNVVGVIHGAAKDADRQSLLLSAHYDHLGVIGGQTYHGANDDASGTAAVLEFARMLGARKKPPRRTVQFALFGCEEQGGHGARYFLAHGPTPLVDYVANIEFEMIGYADPKYPATLMMTGWERSNLGPTLAAHGANVGPDNYPQEHFFERSDNIQLARQGVVAQTISAWPVPPTYHQPTDDLAHLDMDFMLRAIQSLAEPVSWLLDSDFRPQWRPGLKP
jgi:Zn-dependent M28 family amino/carboxypeptidase